MLISLAWRNLARNRRRSVLTGAAVAFGVFVMAWALGVNEGAYDQLINQGARTRMGHLQVLPEGYLDHPEPRLTIPGADGLAARLSQVEGVEAVAARAQADGVLARDNDSAPVEVIGVDPAAEVAATVVPDQMLDGERAARWCHEHMGDALPIMGHDQELFARWCDATARGRYLDAGEPREVVIGAGVAERLLVTVGDELTAQVVRAVDQGGEHGAEAGSLSQRRLEVVGLFVTGNPELDDRVAYVNRGTLTEMLGTDGPNEIVLILDRLRDLDRVRTRAAAVVDGGSPVRVTTWRERNPALASLIEMDTGNNAVTMFIISLLVILGVVNATLMSVLERTKEFGVMLSLGIRPAKLFSLVMTEVALLGVVSVGVGAVLGGAIEVFGRYHGWYMEWFGYDPETLESMTTAGLMYETVYYSALSPETGLVIVSGVYLMFLLAGLWPAVRASRLRPVDAMRAQ